VNKHGHAETLVAAQHGNGNALRHGGFSERVIAGRGAQILEELRLVFGDEPELVTPLLEVARLSAIVELIDGALEERVVDRRGKPSYLLGERRSLSRQLERWYERLLTAAAAAGASRGEVLLHGERADYIAELQAIALGRDLRASTRDRVQALQTLLKLGTLGTGSGAVADEQHRTASALAGDLVGKTFRRDSISWSQATEGSP
jgi:hypothetical protein